MSKPNDNSSKPPAVRLTTSARKPIAGSHNSLSGGPCGALRSIRRPWRKLRLLPPLTRLSKWRRTPAESEVALLRDAEFRVALSELRSRQSVLIHTPCPRGIRLTGVERLDEQEAVLAAQRDVLARPLTLTTNRHRAGYSPRLDPLDAERGSLVAKLALVHGRADRLNALVTPYQALRRGRRSI
jgi:hypothetical protein